MAICRVITSHEKFLELNSQWNELVERSVSGSFSSRFEWLETWLNCYGGIADSLYIILVYNDDACLIGAAPFFFSDLQTKLNRYTEIRFIGTGEPEKIEVASEYLDILALAGMETIVCEAVIEGLLDLPTKWDRLVAENILEDSVFIKYFIPIIQRCGYNHHSAETGQRFQIYMSKTWEHYLSSIRPSVKNKILSSRRKIAQRGKLMTKTVKQEQDRKTAFKSLGHLHTAQWHRKGLSGAFASDIFGEFHEAVTRLFAIQGILCLRTFYIDDELIGVLYNLKFKQKEHYYQSGFDMASYAKYRPGLIAHSLAIQDCIDAGTKEYDFMKGVAPSYKQDYGTHATPMFTSIIFNRTHRGRYLYFQTGIRNQLSNMKRKLKHIYR